MLDPLQRDRVVGPGGAAPTPAQPARPGGATGTGTPGAFGDVLAAKLAPAPARAATPLRFSGHALQRIERRGIDLDDATLSRLDGGVTRAAAKGSKDSLVLVDQTAFVVSVPNRTVITAVDREHMREQVFTNIDSAVIA